MITTRITKQYGRADFGRLQTRYTFFFGHYFDPELLGLTSLRVLNQEMLAPGASFQVRAYLKVDILNLILEGEAEYRDSDSGHVQAKAGEALLIATQPGVSYSEYSLSKEQSLTRVRLWLDACPQWENPLQQKTEVMSTLLQLLAPPEEENGSLQLRRQAWVYHITLEKGGQISMQLHGPRVYLQLIHGTVYAAAQEQQKQALTCGDDVFIHDEANTILVADTLLRVLLVDLPT